MKKAKAKMRRRSSDTPKVIFNPKLPDGRTIKYYPLIGWRAE